MWVDKRYGDMQDTFGLAQSWYDDSVLIDLVISPFVYMFCAVLVNFMMYMITLQVELC